MATLLAIAFGLIFLAEYSTSKYLLVETEDTKVPVSYPAISPNARLAKVFDDFVPMCVDKCKATPKAEDIDCVSLCEHILECMSDCDHDTVGLNIKCMHEQCCAK